MLGYLQAIAAEVLDDESLAARAKELKADIDDGIARHGTVDHPERGRVYAYEVDGAGSALLMDDANMPSLLSHPADRVRRRRRSDVPGDSCGCC